MAYLAYQVNAGSDSSCPRVSARVSMYPPQFFAGTGAPRDRLQKESLRAYCRTRGSPAALIVPKAAVPATVLGAPRGGVFVRLKASARKSSLIDSCMGKVFSRARSALR